MTHVRLAGGRIARPVPSILLASLVLTLTIPAPAARSAGLPMVAAVRTIRGGLTVLPPSAPRAPGQIRELLFSTYALRTFRQQRASLSFVDRSVLFINQYTDLVLRSPIVTVLRRGEIAVTDVPGARHRVVTATAVAAAVGTIFDVFISPRPPAIAPRQLGETDQAFPPGTTHVSVVTGTVVVSNAFGTVRVLPGHWTHVAPGAAPTPPTRHRARDDVAWKRVLKP